VNVDETGREHHSFRINDLVSAVLERWADLANTISTNRDVPDLSGIPAAINDVRVAYQNVTGLHSSWFKL
jgi:hypothetical protein